VRPSNSGASYTVLSPRQTLTPAPYALALPGVSTRSGNVGIGTDNPQRKLHVVGNRIRLENSGKTLDLRADGATIDIESSTNSIIIASRSQGECPWGCNNVLLNPWGNSGRVGIGTTTPGAKLTIVSPPADLFNANTPLRIEDTNGKIKLIVQSSGSLTLGSLSGSSTSHVCATSTSTSVGDIHTLVKCSSAAEYVPTMDTGEGYPEPGDLVSIVPVVENPYDDVRAPFVVSKATSANASYLIGFLLDPEMGADGEKVNDRYLPLAIYGYFPVKVTMQNGPILRGDPITASSTPGYGMKATEPGRIVGYALENATDDGMIQVVAQPGDFIGNAAERIKTLEAQIEDLLERLDLLESRQTR
jgi:hypothetical protein